MAIEPLKALQKKGIGLEWKFIRTHRVNLKHLYWAHIVWFIRDCSPNAQNIAVWAKAIGSAVIYDLDDNLGILPVSSPLGKSSFAHNIRRHVGQMASLADTVGLTSATLIQDLSRLNQTVLRPQYQILNKKSEPSILYRSKENLNQKTSHSKMLVVSPTVRPLDRSFISEVFRILLQRDQNLEIVFLSFSKSQELDRDIKNKVTLKIKSPINNMDKYISYLNSLENPIGLAYLEDTRFNRSKTQAKYRDFAVAGIPGIYSDIPPYSDAVQHNSTGLLVENTPNRWAEQIFRLSLDKSLSKTISINALKDIEINYKFDDYLDHLLHVFSALPLIDSRSKLKKDIQINLGPAIRLIAFPENKKVAKLVQNLQHSNRGLITVDLEPNIDRRLTSIVVKSCNDLQSIYLEYLKVGIITVHLRDCQCAIGLNLPDIKSIYDLEYQSNLILEAAQQLISKSLDLSTRKSNSLIQDIFDYFSTWNSKLKNRIEIFLLEHGIH